MSAQTLSLERKELLEVALSLYERALDFLVTLAVRYAHKVDAEVLNVFCRFARITFRDVDKEEDRKIRWVTIVFLRVLSFSANHLSDLIFFDKK